MSNFPSHQPSAHDQIVEQSARQLLPIHDTHKQFREALEQQTNDPSGITNFPGKITSPEGHSMGMTLNAIFQGQTAYQTQIQQTFGIVASTSGQPQEPAIRPAPQLDATMQAMQQETLQSIPLLYDALLAEIASLKALQPQLNQEWMTAMSAGNSTLFMEGYNLEQICTQLQDPTALIQAQTAQDATEAQYGILLAQHPMIQGSPRSEWEMRAILRRDVFGPQRFAVGNPTFFKLHQAGPVDPNSLPQGTVIYEAATRLAEAKRLLLELMYHCARYTHSRGFSFAPEIRN
jgi:hypothetical protein